MNIDHEPSASERLPEISLFLRFYGVFDPDDLTQRLGFSPSVQWRAGDPKIVGDATTKRRHDAWMIRITNQATVEIDAMLQELRDLVTAPASVVRQACIDLDIKAVILCGVIQSPDGPSASLDFPPDFLKWVSNLGASLNVDVI